MGHVVNAWEILGIAPGSDKRAIKTAYAQRAKECHPEEQPEAFMALRQAYEVALASVAQRSTTHARTATPSHPSTAPSEAAPAVPPRMDTQRTNPDVDPRPIIDAREVGKLALDLKTFLSRPRADQKPEDLETLLGHPLLEFMEVRDRIGQETAHLLAKCLAEAPPNRCPLSRDTLLALDRTFHWSSDYEPLRGAAMDNIYLMLDAAHESELKAGSRLGWTWLGNLFFNFKGRIARREWLFGFVILIADMLAHIGFISGLYTLMPELPYYDAIVLGTVLAFFGIFVSLTLKRSTDAGVHPAAALILSCIFPIVLLFFILGVPKPHEHLPDPRDKYNDPLDTTYWDIRHYGKDYTVLQKFSLLFGKLSGGFLRGLGTYLVIGIAIVPALSALIS